MRILRWTIVGALLTAFPAAGMGQTSVFGLRDARVAELEQLGLRTAGALVVEAVPDDLARTFTIGDVLAFAGSKALITLADLAAAVNAAQGKDIDILFYRGGLPETVSVRLTPAMIPGGVGEGAQGKDGVTKPGGELTEPAFYATSALLDFNGFNPGYISGDEFMALGLRLTASKGRLCVLPAQSPAMVMPAGQGQVLAVKGDDRGGDDRVSEFALEFDPPIRSFTITLPGLRGGASFPTYSITAFNPSGAGFDMVGQLHWIPTVAMPARITLNKGMMTRVVIHVDNRFGNTAWATFSFLPITEIELQR